MSVGRTIGAAVLGLLFGLFVALDLVLFGVVPLKSVVVSILPLVGLVLGGVLGALAGKRQEPVAPVEPEGFAPPPASTF
jgi:hypothetical protein